MSAKQLRRTNKDLSAETVASLIRHARVSFSRLGYEKTSVESVADLAGLSKGAVYYHFKDKSGLFEAVFRDAQAELVGRIDQRAKAAPDPRTAVLSGCEAFVEVALDSELRQIVLVDAPTVLGWSRWRDIDREFGLGSLLNGLRACQASGTEFVESIDVAAHLMSGAMNEGVFMISEAKNRDRAFQAATTVLRAMFDATTKSA